MEEAVRRVRHNGDVVNNGEGCWMWDVEGRRYLDLFRRPGVAMLGHSHPALSARRVAEQASRLIACPNFFYNDVPARFVAKLVEVLPDHLSHVFLSNSGTRRPSTAIEMRSAGNGPHGHRRHNAQLSRTHHRRCR